MKVKVCDAICGAGKTSACINMMNSQTDRKFIFVTQYLTEVERIKQGCTMRGFISPDSDEEGHTTKLADIHRLISAGKNISTTHSLFLSYTDETKKLIRDHNYILVLDEVVDILGMTDISEGDLNILKKSNTLVEGENGLVEWEDDDYVNDQRGRFREEMLRAKSQNFIKFDNNYYFWSIPPELFTCFSEVYVLTYMFEAQIMRCFFEMYNIPYEYIGTKQQNGVYQFCPVEEMDRKHDLRNLVHILEHDKVNAIGERRTALSFSWYRTARKEEEYPDLIRLRNNISNVFKNIFMTKAKDTMWTTFKEYELYLQNKGYSNAFVTYNKRASNEYRHKKYLAYCVNNFPRPWEVRYFKEHGVTINGDMYALSILIQWLFRSAIRKGEEVWIYVPSARMRWLLEQWLKNLANGEDLKPLSYKATKRGLLVPRIKNKN